MLGWVWRWIQARRRARERNLYEYFDGRHFRRVDPWATYRALYGHAEFDMGVQLTAAVAGEEPELSKARKAICESFGCEPYNPDTGRGLTDEELFALLNDFIEWCFALEKKTNGSPILSPNAAAESSSGPVCQEPATN